MLDTNRFYSQELRVKPSASMFHRTMHRSTADWMDSPGQEMLLAFAPLEQLVDIAQVETMQLAAHLHHRLENHHSLSRPRTPSWSLPH